MKKIFVLLGTRQKTGNTTKFVRWITDKLDKKEYTVEFKYPQDLNIKPCQGCNQCFLKTECVNDSGMEELQEKILDADVFIIASPVYLHYFTADLKLILEKCSWWAHTLRLQGKPVVVLSTCDTNGHTSVIKPLSKIMTFMGGNVIACANAARIPEQIDNEMWLDDISNKIVAKIIEYAYKTPQSNTEIEKLFPLMKETALQQKECKYVLKLDMEFEEYNYWRDTGMLDYDTFQEYLKDKYGCEEVAV